MPSLKKGTTDVVRYFMMRKVSDGTAFTGATITTFDLQYTRELTAAATKIDAIVGTGGATTHVDNKVFEVDATDSPGLFMVCFPDAAFASGVDQVTLNLKYDATVFTEAQNIQLVDFDPFDAVRMGMTALPNAAADAAGGLPISDLGGIPMDDIPITSEFEARTLLAADYVSTNGGTISTLDELDTAQDLEHAITQDLVGHISSGSGAIGQNATSVTATSVVQTLTFTATEEEDGVLHELAPSAGTLDFEYLTTLPDSAAIANVTLFCYIASNGDEVAFQYWDWTDSSWKTELTKEGVNGSTLIPLSVPANVAYTGTGANLGQVRFRVFSDGANVVTNVAIDRLRFEYAVVQNALGFEGGAVWYDDINGEAGVVTGIGTITRPSSVEADARTIADANNLKIIHCRPASTFTFEENMDSFEILGRNYSVGLGGQSIEGTYIAGGNVSGTGLATVTPPTFDECTLNSATLPPCIMINCGEMGTNVAGSAGDFFSVDAWSKVAGAGAPGWDMGLGLGATNMSQRRFAGGKTYTNVAAGDVISAESAGGGTLDINGTGGTVEARGLWKEVTDSSGAAVTIVDKSITLDNINAEADTAISDASLPTATEVVDEWETQSQTDPTGFHVNLKEIDGNASLVARLKEFLDANVLFSDTAQAGGASTITLAAGTSLTDNDLEDYAIYLNGGLGAGQFARIESVVAATQVATIVTPNNGWATAPNVTTTYVILSAGSITHISSLHDAALTQITNELDVLAQVNTALDTAIAELGVASPAITPTLRTGMMLMYMMARNQVDVDTTGTDAMKVHNDAGVQIASKAITDDGTDYSEAKMT